MGSHSVAEFELEKNDVFTIELEDGLASRTHGGRPAPDQVGEDRNGMRREVPKRVDVPPDRSRRRPNGMAVEPIAKLAVTEDRTSSSNGAVVHERVPYEEGLPTPIGEACQLF